MITKSYFKNLKTSLAWNEISQSFNYAFVVLKNFLHSTFILPYEICLKNVNIAIVE